MSTEPILTEEEQKANLQVREEIFNLICRENSVLFVGAGCSVGAGYPTWYDLIIRLREQAKEHCDGFDDVEGFGKGPLNDAEVIKSVFKDNGKLDTYYAFLNNLYSPNDQGISDFHKYLVSLRSYGILTTNYDYLLNHALKDVWFDEKLRVSDEPGIVVTDDDNAYGNFLSYLKDDELVNRRIAYVHGCYERPKDIILAKSDYDLRYYGYREEVSDYLLSTGVQEDNLKETIEFLESKMEPFTVHRRFLWSVLALNKVIFIGYGLSDPEINYIMKEVCRNTWGWYRRNSYAIVGIPSNNTSEARKIIDRSKQYHSEYGLVVYFYEYVDRDHSELQRLIEDLAKTNNCSQWTQSRITFPPQKADSTADAPTLEEDVKDAIQEDKVMSTEEGFNQDELDKMMDNM